jgi:hypothetical protein
MSYYLWIENNEINGGSTLLQKEVFTDNRFQVEVSEEVHNSYIKDNLKYVWNGTEVVLNPDYEEEKAKQQREELDHLTLTPADVERALYKAKGMDFEDLKTLIAEKIPSIDLKGLAIEFRAKDFYRGAKSNGIRLFDVVGQLLGYTSDDMDYLFQNKELPAVEDVNGSNEGDE